MSKLDDLLKKQAELQAEIEKIRSEEKSKVIEELKKQILIYNLVPSDLFEIKLPVAIFKTEEANEEEGKRKRRSKDEKEAEDKLKYEKSLEEARKAFEGKIQVRKFENENGINKYYWSGKKGLMPTKGKESVVKSLEEIV